MQILDADREDTAHLLDVLSVFKTDTEDIGIPELCERIKKHLNVVSCALHYNLLCSSSITGKLAWRRTSRNK